MSTPGERLISARVAAGFQSTREAASAIGVPVATYAQHENGIRGFAKERAIQYARAFNSTPEWLLFGKCEPDNLTVEILEDMLRGAVAEVVTFQTRVVDLPELIAPVLLRRLTEGKL